MHSYSKHTQIMMSAPSNKCPTSLPHCTVMVPCVGLPRTSSERGGEGGTAGVENTAMGDHWPCPAQDIAQTWGGN